MRKMTPFFAVALLLILATPVYAQDGPEQSWLDRLFGVTNRAVIAAEAQVEAEQAQADAALKVAETQRLATEEIERIQASAREEIERIQASNTLDALRIEKEIESIKASRDEAISITEGDALTEIERLESEAIVEVAKIEAQNNIDLVKLAERYPFMVALSIILVIVFGGGAAWLMWTGQKVVDHAFPKQIAMVEPERPMLPNTITLRLETDANGEKLLLIGGEDGAG